MEFDIRIDFDLKIEPRTPFESLSQELFIQQAEVYMKANVHKIIKAIEMKLTSEFNPDDRMHYGIKAIEINPPTRANEEE